MSLSLRVYPYYVLDTIKDVSKSRAIGKLIEGDRTYQAICNMYIPTPIAARLFTRRRDIMVT